MSKLLKRYQLNLTLDEDYNYPELFTGVYRGNIELPQNPQLLSTMDISYSSNLELYISVIEDSYSKKTQKYEFIAVQQDVSEILIDSFTFLDSRTRETNIGFISYDIFYRKLS